MKRLTPKQKEVYECIATFQERNGYPPSVREIGEILGMKSPSTVHFHLRGLERAGALHKTEGKTRSLTLEPAENILDPIEMPNNIAQIPVLGNVAAGTPILAQEYIEDYLPFDPQGAPEEFFALCVRGESMLQAGILPGDLVVVHQQQDNFHNGDIVVALFEDEATVKTLRRTDGTVWLMPENPDYSPIDGTNAQLIGKVTAVVRRY